ncbi:chaplin [Peterkaempfera bronchialis]|uniref:Chaplin n=1 Tax=Peterkaempfera bronchialis TaxID=2126346 RepID=A0A345SS72_9ACTN|nr:chaplin [Peterkaempfera bronchialis]AXI76577.1 chaplin [Peterkaempfera bronchialis]
MNKITKAAVLTAVAGCLMSTGAGTAYAGGAEGAAVGSPGVLSGNLIQVPITVPINVCGNGISLLAALNPTGGNVCINAETRRHRERGVRRSEEREFDYSRTERSGREGYGNGWGHGGRHGEKGFGRDRG